jgi:hypothetical protein
LGRGYHSDVLEHGGSLNGGGCRESGGAHGGTVCTPTSQVSRPKQPPMMRRATAVATSGWLNRSVMSQQQQATMKHTAVWTEV